MSGIRSGGIGTSLFSCSGSISMLLILYASSVRSTPLSMNRTNCEMCESMSTHVIRYGGLTLLLWRRGW